MSNARLEKLRLMQSEIETMKETMVEDLLSQPKGTKDQVLQDHRLKLRMDRVVRNAKDVLQVYEDKDKVLRDDIHDMKSRNYLNVFHRRFSEIRRYHEENPNIPTPSEIPHIEPAVDFSGEEWHGRFVDLNQFYLEYINLRVFQNVSRTPTTMNSGVDGKQKKTTMVPIDYKTFLSRFLQFWRIKNSKKDAQYVKFYQSVLTYLLSFWERTHPLAPSEKILTMSEDMITHQWNDTSVEVEGWQTEWTDKTKQKYEDETFLLPTANANVNANGNATTDNDNDVSMTDTTNTKTKSGKEEMDDDTTNSVDASGPVTVAIVKKTKSGVTTVVKPMDVDDEKATENATTNGVTQNGVSNVVSTSSVAVTAAASSAMRCYACDKRFKSGNTMQSHFKSKRHQKQKKVAILEGKVQLFADLLEDNFQGAKEYIEKKQTRTYDEIRRELDEAEADDAELSESEDDEEADPTKLNPLNIPLDFDGKPIPYWLYKFRGLNRYFSCEICGDRKYRGPQAFERHFREWRHADGMRRLGIPNTKDFHKITSIQDALNLHDKLKHDKASRAWNAEEEEEFEDVEGNVYKKPTYEQLKRQGII